MLIRFLKLVFMIFISVQKIKNYIMLNFFENKIYFYVNRCKLSNILKLKNIKLIIDYI